MKEEIKKLLLKLSKEIKKTKHKKELIKSREKKLQLAAPFHHDKPMVLRCSK